jgi:hypothetical protein
VVPYTREEVREMLRYTLLMALVLLVSVHNSGYAGQVDAANTLIDRAAQGQGPEFELSIITGSLFGYVNGDFEQDLSTGWTVSNYGGVVERITNGDSDPDYELHLSRDIFDDHAEAYQSSDISDLDEVISFKAKLVSQDCWIYGHGYAFVIIRYKNDLDAVLGETRYYQSPFTCSNSPTSHCIKVNDTDWHTYSITISDELEIYLTGIDQADVDRIEICFRVEGTIMSCTAHVYADDITPSVDGVCGMSGTIFDDANGNDVYDLGIDTPLDSAVVTASFGHCDTTDAAGEFLILGVDGGYGYEVTASRGGYLNNAVADISVSCPGLTTGIDIPLVPSGTATYLVQDLEIDLNPPNSLVMQGGALHRYYSIVDSVSGEPRAGIKVLVDGDPSMQFTSDQDGVVKVSIPSSRIGDGLPDATGVFTISHVNGREIDPGDRVAFQAGVVGRRYSRIWQNELYMKAGISIFRFDKEFGSSVELEEVSALNPGPDSILIGRQWRVGGGVAWGVGTPVQVEMGPVVAGAGGEIGVSVTGSQEDTYRFSYAPGPASVAEAEAQYILFFDGNKLTAGAALVAILAYLEGGFEGIEDILLALDTAYLGDEKGLAVGLHGSASAPLGFPPSATLGVGGKLGVGGEGNFGVKARWNRVEGLEEKSFYFSGKVSAEYGGLTWGDPFNSTDTTEEFLSHLAIYATVDRETGVEYRVAMDAASSTWRHSSLSYLDRRVTMGSGTERLTTYTFSGCDEVRCALENASPEVTGLHSSFTNPVSFWLPNCWASNILYTASMDIARLQALGSDAVICYEVTDTGVSELFRFPVNVALSATGEQAVSCQVGGDLRFYQYDTGLVEKGRWIKGRHLCLEEYESTPALSNQLPDIISLIEEQIPWWIKAAAFAIDIFTPWTLAPTDTFFVGDTGSYMVLEEGAIPDTSQVSCYSWSWWGSSPSAQASRLSARRYLVARRLKEQLQEFHNMDYGVGGFYQFEPHRMGLMAPCSLTIVYPDSDIVGLDEGSLRMYREDPESNNWEFVGGVIDTAANAVTAHVDTLWTYTLAPRMPAGGFSLIPFPDSMPADGVSLALVSSDTIFNNDSTVVADGTLFTVWADGCSLLTADADTSEEGTQIGCTDGIISFDVQSEVLPMDVSLGARSVYGAAVGSGIIALTDTVPPAAPTGLVVTCEDGELYASWERNSELDLCGYLVHYDTDGSGPPYDGTASIRGTHSPIDVGDDTCRVITGLSYADTFYVSVTAYDVPGNVSAYSAEFVLESAGVPDLPGLGSQTIHIFPNPLRTSTTIELNVRSESYVSLTIYNIRGRLVSTVVDRQFEAGRYSFQWDGRDRRGERSAPGIYFVRAQLGRDAATHKVVLLR